MNGLKQKNMNESKIITQRDSGIELLRIITMLGVITLHFNSAGFKAVSQNSINYYFMNLTEGMFICAVDLFMLISGYYMCTYSKRKLIKPLELIIQVILFKLIWRLGGCIFKQNIIPIKSLIYTMLPNNYFVILYTSVYFITVYFTDTFNNLSKKKWDSFIVILMLLFSVWQTFFDFIGELAGNEIQGISTLGMYGSGEGFTITTFTLMYIIGAYIRINKLDKKYTHKGKLVACYAVCAVILAITGVINKYLGTIKLCSAWEYCNPIVILEAVVIFFLFKNIQIRSRIINSLSKATFTCFLVHQRFFVLMDIEGIAQQPIYILILYWIISTVIIYLISYIIFKIYNILTKPIFWRIDKKFEKMNWNLNCLN